MAGGIPERPYFRSIIPAAKKPVRRIVKDGVDPRTLVVDAQLARRIGETVSGQVRSSIDAWNTPPNAATTENWKGRNDPLVDSGTLASSASYKLEK